MPRSSDEPNTPSEINVADYQNSNRLRNVVILITIGIASLTIRALISYDFDQSALLYVGIPFLVAVTLLWVVKKPSQPSLTKYYLYLIGWSLIVMLGTSIILFEGFVCVVMFMPIYFGILLLMYLFQLFVQYLHKGQMKLELTQVQNDYIRTTFMEDSSYIGNYLKLKGTEISFLKTRSGKSKVQLTIHYHRFLDPAWYFGPIQEYAIGQTALLLLNELFVPATASQTKSVKSDV